MKRAVVTLGRPPGRVLAEVARGPAERVRGLRFRRDVPEGTGMLFVFEAEAVQTFTMRGVRVPLDLIFLDSHQKVVGIVRHAEPGEPMVGVRRASRLVLETAAGFAAAHRVAPGQRATIRRARPGRPGT